MEVSRRIKSLRPYWMPRVLRMSRILTSQNTVPARSGEDWEKNVVKALNTVRMPLLYFGFYDFVADVYVRMKDIFPGYSSSQFQLHYGQKEVSW